MTAPQPDDRLTNAGVAVILEIQPDTWRGMVKRGQAPAADGVEPLSGYRWWYRSTIEHFATHRKGRGFRSDLGPAGRKPIRPGRPDPVSY